ncbi:cyclic nucleotide-binding domain-containing protein [Thermodesulfobacteriota bacterium]
MFPIASEKRYEDGDIVYKEGNAGDWIYIVLSGSVEISKDIGKRYFILGSLGTGDIFGDHSYLGGINRATTVRSIGKSTLGIIDRIPLDREFNMLSNNLREIIRSMTRRYSELLDKVIDLSPQTNDPVPKSLSLTFRDPNAFIRAYTGNPDKSGLFIRTEKLFNKGENLTLKLKLPNLPYPIKIECIVAWTRKHSDDPANRPSGMGIHFIHIDESDELILNEYFEKITKNSNYKFFNDISQGRRSEA